MKKILLSAAAWLLAANFAAAQQTVIHDPNAEARPVGSFSAIKISDAIDLYLSQGDQDAVAVSAAEDKFRNNIKVGVENGVLKIWYAKDGISFSGNKKLKAYVSFRSIRQLSASGASDVIVNGTIKGDELAISLSGASDFKGEIALNTLRVDQSGASDASISGRAVNVFVHAAGASDCKGYGLAAENCTVQAAGASDIQITVNKALTATASGASSVYYKGTGAVVEAKANGSSNVSRKS